MPDMMKAADAQKHTRDDASRAAAEGLATLIMALVVAAMFYALRYSLF